MTAPEVGIRDPSVYEGIAARRRGGAVIGVVGPDGSGKSTLIDALTTGPLRGVTYQHLRSPGVLYRRNRGGGAPVTEPHAKPAYGMLSSLAKTLYLFVDHLLGWFLSIAPRVRRGEWVIIERGWWDMAVDPRRYRLDPRCAPLVTGLGHLLPAADAVLVLETDATGIYARKQELPLPEIERQMQRWRAILPRRQARLFLDSGASPRDTVQRALAGLRSRSAMGAGHGWTALPSGKRPRWTLPRGPRAAAAAGLGVYHPMTNRGRLAWSATRRVAALGGFYLSSRAPAPEAVLSLVRPFVPARGTIAVATTNHPGRRIALVLDAGGRPTAVAKVGLGGADPGIAREVEAIRTLGPLLPPPVSAPSVIASEGSRLVEEHIAWVVRKDPWRLPPEVAAALGGFFAAGRVGELGPAHGDCAPWNLLRTKSGWTLIDWERATSRDVPFSDPFNYLVQAHALLGRPSAGTIVRGVHGRGWVGRVVAVYADAAGVPREAAPELFVRWLADSARRQDAAAEDGLRCIAARKRLLSCMRDRP